MSTYEARCAKLADRGATSSGRLEFSVAAEGIESIIRRARRERSLALWSMVQAVFGRPDARDQNEKAVSVRERTIVLPR